MVVARSSSDMVVGRGQRRAEEKRRAGETVAMRGDFGKIDIGEAIAFSGFEQ